MRYLWLILILIPTWLYSAGEVATVGGKADSAIASIMGKAGTGIGTLCGKTYNDGDSVCNPATHEVGDRGEYSTDVNLGTDDAICSGPYTPECSGTLKYGYVRHSGTGTDNAKVCVYLDDGDGVADADDTKVGCTGAITGNADDTWYTDSSTIGGAVSTGSSYWVCVASNSTNWVSLMNTSGTHKRYTVDAFGYTTPPNTLTGDTITLSDSSSEFSVYVTIE